MIDKSIIHTNKWVKNSMLNAVIGILVCLILLLLLGLLFGWEIAYWTGIVTTSIPLLVAAYEDDK